MSASPATPLRVAPAVTPDDRRRALLLHRRAGAAGEAQPAREPAMTLLAWEGRLVVGCIGISRHREGRFAMEARGVRLPGWLPRDATGEVSRWAALPRHGLRVQVALAAAAAAWMAEEGMSDAIALLTPEGHRRMIRAGLGAVPLGPPRAVPVAGRAWVMHPVWAPLPRPRAAAPAPGRILKQT